MGIDKDKKITGVEVTLYQDGGWNPNESVPFSITKMLENGELSSSPVYNRTNQPTCIYFVNIYTEVLYF